MLLGGNFKFNRCQMISNNFQRGPCSEKYPRSSLRVCRILLLRLLLLSSIICRVVRPASTSRQVLHDFVCGHGGGIVGEGVQGSCVVVIRDWALIAKASWSLISIVLPPVRVPLHVPVCTILIVRAHRRVCRVVLHWAHGHGRVRIRILPGNVDHGLLLHFDLLAACRMRTTVVLAMVQLVNRHSLILVSNQAVFISFRLLLRLLSKVLVQMRIATWRLQELLLGSGAGSWREVVLHGHSPLAHRGDRTWRLIDLILWLLGQDHRLVTVVNITLRALVLLLLVPWMLFRGLKWTLVQGRSILRLHVAVMALLRRLWHSANEVVAILHGLLLLELWILAIAQFERRIVVRNIIRHHLLRLYVSLRKMLILLLLLHQAQFVT